MRTIPTSNILYPVHLVKHPNLLWSRSQAASAKMREVVRAAEMCVLGEASCYYPLENHRKTIGKP